MERSQSITTVAAQPAWSGWKVRQKVSPYVFLAPYFIIMSTFFLYPLIYSMVLAFFQTNGPRSKVFIGLENFIFVLHDPDFWTALKNTAIYAACSVALILPISLGLALLLNTREDKLKNFFRLIIFSPHLVGQVFVAIIFTILFQPKYGLFNRFLQSLVGWGLEMNWFGNPELVMPGLVIISIWMYAGFNMIYFLAALQNVDQSLVEAARIDGANSWQVFWHVTLPSIKHVATFVVVVSTIGSFQLFELPYVLLQGTGPNNSGLTLVGYLYQTAFETGDLGTAAAIGWLLAMIIFVISVAQIRISGTLRAE